MPRTFKRCTKCGNNYTIYNYYYNYTYERYYPHCKCCHRAMVARSSGCSHTCKKANCFTSKKVIKKAKKKTRTITISIHY